MIKILEDNGVDTTCLQQDTSICEDESVLYQDLSDAVAALARKLSSSKTSDKMAEKMKVNATGRFAVHDLASTVNGEDKIFRCFVFICTTNTSILD